MSEEVKKARKYPYYKYSDINASFIRKIYRHIGGKIAVRLLKTKVTPNMLTITSFLFLLIAAALVIRQEYIFVFLSAVAVFISIILDKADGSLARMQKKGTSLGVWLDSITDNFSIIVFVLAMSVHSFIKTSNPIFALAGISCILSFQTTKFAYLRFKYTFTKANDVIEKEKKSHRLRSNFHVTEYFLLNWSMIFLLFNKVEWFLLIMGIYGWVFYIGMTGALTHKAVTMSKVLTEEEELLSK